MAGGPKTCFAFSIPITRAASETNSMKGHIILVSQIVSSVLSGGQLHHVSRSTNCDAKTMPRSVTTLMKTAVSVATLLASRQADSSPSVAILPENVVMKAVERAPSANKSRNKFGRRKAIKKASRYFPAPKSPAKICSRISPRIRLDKIATPTIPVARVLTRRFSEAVMRKKESDSRGLGNENCYLTNRLMLSKSLMPRLKDGQ